MEAFSDIFVDQTSAGVKIPKEEYLENGKHIIVDQGQNPIAGYTNRETGLYTDVPAIVFGDHTRIIKYVDKPFFLGADGVKLLKSKKEKANYKYLYYALKNARIPNTGYNRHFKWLKEVFVEYPDADRQKMVVDILDRISEVIDKRHQVIHYLDELIKARFVEIFGDPRSNPRGYEKRELRSTCSVITGNTPSRSVSEYYGNYIEWIKTDNIVTGRMTPSSAVECLSESGLAVGRSVNEGAILMACIAGSIASIGRVCMTDRRVAFNQQINAIIPNMYDVRFLFVLLQISKDYLVEEINMALKGILSKTKLEEKLFYVPPMDLQKQFAGFFEQIDKSKSAIQQSLNKTQLLFDSLMQEYFG